MALLPSLWRHAAWIAAPALVASQEVEIPRAGTVVLATQGPIRSRRFAGLRYALVLTRPTIATGMAWVVGIVLSAGFAVTSRFVLVMRVVGVR